MDKQTFWQEFERRVGKYDLLCHPFYKAWSAGELTREDLREYAAEYYHHVASFPTYLMALHARLEDGPMRKSVLSNYWDEQGVNAPDGRPHDDLWLDFAEGMGASDAEVRRRQPLPEIRELIDWFLNVARTGTPAQAVAAFYAYESQVPRVAREKYVKLREKYGADDVTCNYFDLHATADVYHASVWKRHLEKELEAHPEHADGALEAGEQAAAALWKALDGMERARHARVAA